MLEQSISQGIQLSALEIAKACSTTFLQASLTNEDFVGRFGFLLDAGN